MPSTMHSLPEILGLLPAVVLLWASAAAAQPYTVDYTYDAQGRLTGAAYSTAFTVSYQYDAAGNLLSVALDDPTPIEDDLAAGVPDRFALHASYPNPFNPATTIPFDVKAPVRVRLAIYDVLGRKVTTLIDRDFAPGWHEAVFEAQGLPAGLYFYQMQMGDFRAVKTMVLAK